MVDFLLISFRSTKRGVIEIYPNFFIRKSSDLMIRGGDFYAIWLEEKGLWSTDEQDALQLIDRELDRYAEENNSKFDANVKVLHMWDAESGMIDSWHKYCQKQMRDCFHILDDRLIFSNTETTKKDYASRKLNYPLEEGNISAYDLLMSTLYTEEERHKLEWAIGSIVAGESQKLQKFVVIYGAVGSGKSTVLNIIQQLFEGYYAVFDAKALGSANNAFALEAFRTNPLVAIQHDGDLSHIEDNTRLNSLVSHEMMTVNEKFKSAYASRFRCFLFLGTNKPVKITDAKSGLIRRLIDVSPSGNKLAAREYRASVKQIGFELGAIAFHCRQVYLEDPDRYDSYIPMAMLGASNDFYNFVVDSYYILKKEDGITMKAAWELYKTYCEEAKVTYPFSQRIFKEELKNYFRDYSERYNLEDGSRVRSYYSGFRKDIFEENKKEEEKPKKKKLVLESRKSMFDEVCAELPAQYATEQGTPMKRWDEVNTTLAQIDTTQLHYVKVPENHIVIDFDIPGENGEKDLERNLEEAAKWPKTYAELSKSGSGVHLHYIYTGDPARLSRVYGDHVEIKVFTGKSSLRRKLTLCNGEPIASISSGLPLKGESETVNFKTIKSENALRTLIRKNLNKEILPNTRPSIDLIYNDLKASYDKGLHYDVSDMRNAVIAFAAGSTHQADACLRLVNRMKFRSEDMEPNLENVNDDRLIFFDVEVFPNLFLINWKVEGEGKSVVRMINPSPEDVESLMRFNLVGFNCRRYDNHILYARAFVESPTVHQRGYTNEDLYHLSQKLIKDGGRDCYFGEAYNVSYTDVYDFSSKKQSLKKFEIELGIHHQELGLSWDQPVPKDLWMKVAEYCDNDVLATEAVFHARKADFLARQILADVAGMSVNDTTNMLTTRIIFGDNRNPQNQFNYRDLAVPVGPERYDEYRNKFGDDYIFHVFNEKGEPTYQLFDPAKNYPKGYSILPFFPGYSFEGGKSLYRGVEVGEGGNVFAKPGLYGNAALLDIESMHPHSATAEVLFGQTYTKRFSELLEARLAVKHKDIEKAKKMLGGKLEKYLADENTAGDLSQALKITINSVYGLTSASFKNSFRDIRNVDNIVAKRGALFMVNLRDAVLAQGFRVAHIKTDSIKIPDASPFIIEFVQAYGREYGYNFEHEATYERMCLVNDAVYIARYATVEGGELLYGKNYVSGSRDILKENKKHPGEWTATGTQFAVPYVFKKLFTRETIEFADLCETKSVSSALYLDLNENLPEGEHDYRFVGKVGQFCPMKPGSGGGILLRETVNAKTGEKGYASATGSKGYRWLESEVVQTLEKEKEIDLSYYNKMVDEAAKKIAEYGDLEWFVSDDPYIPQLPFEPDGTTAFDVR